MLPSYNVVNERSFIICPLRLKIRHVFQTLAFIKAIHVGSQAIDVQSLWQSLLPQIRFAVKDKEMLLVKVLHELYDTHATS